MRKTAQGAVWIALGALLLPLAMGCGDSSGGTPPGGITWTTLDGKPPLVIGHRGASGYRPEHTLESYMLAIEQGADFIEPDLVSTQDGHLVARHEPDITTTTDVATHPEFASRKVMKMLDGVSVDGFFASDFTLAEIKTLRAVQPRTYRPQEYNGLYEIPTLEEIIALVKAKSTETGRTIGIYPEMKHPRYHTDLGLPLENKLVSVLQSEGLNEADSPVIVQCFEVSPLQTLRMMSPLRLVQLIDADGVDLAGKIVLVPPYDKPYDFAVSGDMRTFADLLTAEGLSFVKTYADGVGPWKRYIASTSGVDADMNGFADDINGDMLIDEADRTVLGPGDVITRAHAAGLFVHAYTFRSEPIFLGKDYEGDPANEYKQFYDLGIDGLFTDFPDHAVQARPR